ncbi:hypothetical protein HPG69_005749, partial [Diceros bicornis minor]
LSHCKTFESKFAILEETWAYRPGVAREQWAASALGHIQVVQKLVESGVNVNSQNKFNSWTSLHWTCKHNHGQVVPYLRNSSPINIKERNHEDLRVEDDLDEDNLPQLKKESELPFVPNNLANPAFPFIYTPTTEDLAQLLWGWLTSIPPPWGTSPVRRLSTRPHLLTLVQNWDVSTPSTILRTPESIKLSPFCEPPVSQSHSPHSSVPSKLPVSLELQSRICTRLVLAFHPFFFTETFPFNRQEVVLKVRI